MLSNLSLPLEASEAEKGREDRQLFLQTTTRPINRFSGRSGPTPDSAGPAVLLGTLVPIISVEDPGSSTPTMPRRPLSQVLPVYTLTDPGAEWLLKVPSDGWVLAGALAPPQIAC